MRIVEKLVSESAKDVDRPDFFTIPEAHED
jgi:hypothetical protein